MLAQLSNLAADGSAELDIAMFVGQPIEMGDLEIGVDEYVKERVGEIEKVRDVYSWMQESFTFEFDGQTFFLLTFFFHFFTHSYQLRLELGFTLLHS